MFEKNEVVVVGGKKYALLEEVNPVVEVAEDGEAPAEGEATLALAKAIELGVEPNEKGWYPLCDISYVRGKDGQWVPDDVQGCAFADENGNLVGVMYWDEQRQVIQIVEDDSLVKV